MSDLRGILIFTKKLEETGSQHLDICDQVSDLLSKLESGKRDNQYMKIVQVITKYLEGIRKFISNTEIK